jgi:hypothetical protein
LWDYEKDENSSDENDPRQYYCIYEESAFFVHCGTVSERNISLFFINLPNQDFHVDLALLGDGQNL